MRPALPALAWLSSPKGLLLLLRQRAGLKIRLAWCMVQHLPLCSVDTHL